MYTNYFNFQLPDGALIVNQMKYCCGIIPGLGIREYEEHGFAQNASLKTEYSWRRWPKNLHKEWSFFQKKLQLTLSRKKNHVDHSKVLPVTFLKSDEYDEDRGFPERKNHVINLSTTNHSIIITGWAIKGLKWTLMWLYRASVNFNEEQRKTSNAICVCNK